MNKTLDKIIIEVLKSSQKPLSVRQITEIISKDKLWFRPSDKKLPDATQVSARVNNYPQKFIRQNGFVTLNTENIKVSQNKILIANITWSPSGWRDNSYINPKAGHQYAKENVGGESLNFNFNKKTIDTEKHVHGYIQWTNRPTKFENGGLVIFYTRNTDLNKGKIVGVYGKTEIFEKAETHKVPFQKNDYWINIKGEKDFSLLFPFSLDADNYKENSSDRMVGQIGFTYKDETFAEQILFDELTELSKAGTNEKDFKKLNAIYEFYIGKKFKLPFISIDEKEQKELEHFFNSTKSRADILNDLNNLQENDAEEIIINRKTYKRDNKTIAQLKIIRNHKCQICGLSIPKKDGSKYVEAAHIKPKYQKGRETPENIILLCPNHHKEFDLGEPEIIIHNKSKIEFLLNGITHKIILELDKI
jgi:HNH endonuclease